MPDLTKETTITISEAPAQFPGRPHLTTCWRWILRGVRGVKLESTVVGGRRFTSIEACERFKQRTNAAAGGTLPETATEPVRKREIEKAEAACVAAGI